MAVVAGVESAVQIHIDRGDDLNARDVSGMTPLMLAASRNKASVCRLLLGAGADPDLLDPSGKTALEIAVATGSDAAAAILRAVNVPIPYLPTSEVTRDPKSSYVVGPSPTDRRLSPEAMVAPGLVDSADPPVPEAVVPQPKPESLAPLTPVVEIDCEGGLDLSGWEAEEGTTPPEANFVVLDSASAIQSAITAHEPIDTSVGWDDIDAYLPEQALHLALADNAEGRSQLRLLLLRAIREGSVPYLDVQELSANDDRSSNPMAEAFLAMVINDLGAETDERIEHADTDGSAEVFVDSDETLEEEEILDQALGAIDSAASPRHEPLRIYQREFQRLRLLTANEEVELAQAMEAALETALDALVDWPAGIAQTLKAGAQALAGERTLSSIWLGDSEPDPEPASIENADSATSETELAEDVPDEGAVPAVEAQAAPGDASFAEALHRLGALAGCNDAHPPAADEIRLALAALRLNRLFLMELGDAADGTLPCPRFACAMSAFRRARDRMAVANLKLAFFHAKRYRFSGEPLDDLAQEANIGLLKAVDRYQWQRGYRFSTYATWWIRQQIGRHVADRARAIRVPVHVFEKTQRIVRVVEAFEVTFGRTPTVDEIAARAEMSPPKVTTLLQIVPNPSPIDEATVDNEIAAYAQDEFSLPDPSDAVEATELRAAVNMMLSSLPAKHERIIKLRFGIGTDEPLTLEEIGQHFGLTRERIRQIEAKAIRTLKHPARSEPFARLALGISTEPEIHCSAVARNQVANSA